MNGLPGNSLHTANTCSRTPIKKIITCVLCIESVGSVFQGNVLTVESACVCTFVKYQTCSNTLQKAYYCILYTCNPATNPNKPTDYYDTLCICRSVSW